MKIVLAGYYFANVIPLTPNGSRSKPPEHLGEPLLCDNLHTLVEIIPGLISQLEQADSRNAGLKRPSPVMTIYDLLANEHGGLDS